jgi:hypothetical protein
MPQCKRTFHHVVRLSITPSQTHGCHPEDLRPTRAACRDVRGRPRFLPSAILRHAARDFAAGQRLRRPVGLGHESWTALNSSWTQARRSRRTRSRHRARVSEKTPMATPHRQHTSLIVELAHKRFDDSRIGDNTWLVLGLHDQRKKQTPYASLHWYSVAATARLSGR